MEERIGRIRTDFFFDFLLEIRAFVPTKNPFVSARSAPSVLPSYLHLPKRKLLNTKKGIKDAFILNSFFRFKQKTINKMIHHSSFIIHHYFLPFFSSACALRNARGISTNATGILGDIITSTPFGTIIFFTRLV
jgi:hypothetical protein